MAQTPVNSDYKCSHPTVFPFLHWRKQSVSHCHSQPAKHIRSCMKREENKRKTQMKILSNQKLIPKLISRKKGHRILLFDRLDFYYLRCGVPTEDENLIPSAFFSLFLCFSSPLYFIDIVGGWWMRCWIDGWINVLRSSGKVHNKNICNPLLIVFFLPLSYPTSNYLT